MPQRRRHRVIAGGHLRRKREIVTNDISTLLSSAPLPRPRERHKRVVRRRVCWRPHLDLPLDFKPCVPQEADPVTVREVKLDARIPRPFDPVHPELSATLSPHCPCIPLRDAAKRPEADLLPG